MIWILILVGLCGVYFCIQEARRRELQRRRNAALARLKPYEPHIHEAVTAFEQLLSSGRYIANRDHEQWKTRFKEIADVLALPVRELNPADPFQQTIVQFCTYYVAGRPAIDDHNRNLSVVESEQLQKLLESRRIPHNANQLAAAVSEEDNTLVVAGAGTGKTTTILGKVTYLIDRLHVRPEDILLLSFTGKAVEELGDRVATYLPGIPVEVKTFHGFGLSIIGQVLKARPDVAFEDTTGKQELLNNAFDEHLADPPYLGSAVHYFAFYLKPHDVEPRFRTLDEYYRYIRTERVLTFQKERVKSQQEAMIANFLYLHNIRYAYERPYPVVTATQDHRQYKPDFYLPDHDVYLEHFGIDRSGRVHLTEDEDKNAQLSCTYNEEMAWKRDLHQAHDTRLIETYSYDFQEHAWEQRLTEKLTSVGIELRPRPWQEVWETLRSGDQVAQITNLFLTFLDLAKANHYSVDQLEKLVAQRGKPRERAFLDLFLPVYRAYEAHLADTNAIDFHDMLNRATEFITDGQYKTRFRYIIIDEFQDFSVSKNHLVQALCRGNPGAKLFCVGDDWQSIFRFAGSDVSLMTNFEKHHGFTNNLQLTMTNRFDSKLAHISNQFIMKNPKQLKKEITASRTSSDTVLEVVVPAGKEGLDKILSELSLSVGSGKATVMLLGRYNHNKPSGLTTYRRAYRNLQIDFRTVHRAKGSEADYVIVLDIVGGRYGFPSDIADDPILEIVLSEGEPFPHAEERRLMYVALTRARRKVFLLLGNGPESVFVSELQDDLELKKANAMSCKECGGAMVLIKGHFGPFYGCSNYPDCRYRRKAGAPSRSRAGRSQ